MCIGYSEQINDKHIEVIVRQCLKRSQIVAEHIA